MTLDEGIQYCLEVASENDSQATEYNEHDEWEFVNKCNCEQCAADHRQLAEWLKELKDLRILIGGEDNYLTEYYEDEDYEEKYGVKFST